MARTRIRRTVMVMVVAATGALGGASAAVGAAEVPPDDLCAAAQALTEAGRPQRALALVDARDTAAEDCLDVQAEAAQTAIADAEITAQKALADVAKAPAAAWDAAGDALQADADNVTATEVREEIGAEPDATEPTGPPALKEAWDAFFADVLSPLQDVVLPMLTVLAVLLVLARMLLVLPVRWPRTSDAFRSVLWAGGVAAGVLAAWLLVAGVAEAASAGADGAGADAGAAEAGVAAGAGVAWAGAAWLGGTAAVVAVVLLAMGMATRLRMTVEVYGSGGDVDQAATGHVIALLAQLGAESPRGLEVPRGADVTALDGAPISAAPEAKVLAAVARLWQLVFGVTPWLVRVDVESADRHSVVVSRNGHTVAAGVVDREVLALRTTRARLVADGAKPTPEQSAADLPDLHVFAAAMTIVELAKAYRGFEGLFGVRDWRSVGLQYVGVEHYAAPDDGDAARAVLARAVQLAPENLPALVALRHAEGRRAQNGDVLEAYLAFLLDIRSRLDGEHAEALRARVLLTTLVTGGNLAAVKDTQVSHDAILAGVELVDLLRTLKASRATAPLALSMRQTAAGAFLSALDHNAGRLRAERLAVADRDARVTTARATAELWLGKPNTLGPHGHYNYACWKVATSAHQQAIAHLRLAATSPGLAEWMHKDPWLAELRQTQAFREALNAEPVTDVLTLGPLAAHAPALKALGLTSAERLAVLPPSRLAAALKVEPMTAAHLTGVARLVESVDGALAPLRVVVVAALLEHGVDSPEALAGWRHGRKELPTAVHGALMTRTNVELAGEGDPGSPLNLWFARHA